MIPIAIEVVFIGIATRFVACALLQGANETETIVIETHCTGIAAICSSNETVTIAIKILFTGIAAIRIACALLQGANTTRFIANETETIAIEILFTAIATMLRTDAVK